MIKLNSPRCLLTSIVMALLLSQSAAAIVILDGYVGGNDNGHGDVVGDPGNFDINSMDVSLSGTTLSVSVSTTFAGKAGLYPSYTDTPYGLKKGIGYGDLFLSSNWNPFGSSGDGYIKDDKLTGTKWTYGFSLDDRWRVDGDGAGTLYSLNSGDNSDILLSDNFLSRGTYRNNQEVAVKTSADVTAVSSGSWSIDVINDLITFEIELAGTALVAGPEIALHWGFTCANDVIEGAIDVPEPKVYLLLSMGLLGMLVLRRKRFKA